MIKNLNDLGDITRKKIYRNVLPGCFFLLALGIGGVIKADNYFLLGLGVFLLLMTVIPVEYVEYSRKKSKNSNSN
jgi:hypothetical protein